jgi:hypothetical protein
MTLRFNDGTYAHAPPTNEKRLAMAEAAVANRIDDILRLRVLVSGFEQDGFEDAADQTRALLVTAEEQLRLRVQELDQIKGETDRA